MDSAEIAVEEIGRNRYAAGEASVVKLYSANGADSMTLAQLLASISVRLAAVLEDRSVFLMNQMLQKTELMSSMGQVGEQMMRDGVGWNTQAEVTADFTPKSATFRNNPTIYNFLVYECDADASALPSAIDIYEDKLTAFKELDTRMQDVTSVSQDLEIDLKTCMTRRDVAYSTATNVSKRYTQSMSQDAENF